ncbi:MAG: DNA-directed RNA polymerase subunit K [Nanoarchaeota archaeon]
MKEQFSKYERARILGARAMQLAMDAPLLLKIDEKLLSNLNFDPLRIAETELDSGVLPITVNRPMPQKREEKLEKIKIEDAEEGDDKKIEVEKKEEKEIYEEGEIMEMNIPEEEGEIDLGSSGESGGEEEF